MPEIQTQIDFSTRGARLRLLRELQLPKLPGTRPSTMIAVLQAIDDRAGLRAQWLLRVAEIQQAIGMRHRAAVDRAINSLEQLGLVSVARVAYGAWYTIEWEALEKLRSETSRDSARRKLQIPRSANSRLRAARRETSRCAERDSAQRGLQEPAQAQNLPPPTPTEWEEVEAKLREENVGTVAECLAACQQRNASPAELLAIVADYRRDASLGKWNGPGALAWRLMRGEWPAPSERYQRQERRESARQAETAQAIADQAARNAVRRDREAEADREQRHGATVDDLTDCEVQTIIDATGNKFLAAELIKHGRTSTTIRGALLDAVEQRCRDPNESFAARAAGR